jgi:hypothetical protein
MDVKSVKEKLTQVLEDPENDDKSAWSVFSFCVLCPASPKLSLK